MIGTTAKSVTTGGESPGADVAAKFQQETLDAIKAYQDKNKISHPVAQEDLQYQS
jgi:hypothetical protein